MSIFLFRFQDTKLPPPPAVVQIRYFVSWNRNRSVLARGVALVGRLTAIATVRGRLGTPLRNGLLRLLDRLASVRRRLVLKLSGLSWRPYARLG